MKTKSIDITRDQSVIMRGMAIMLIALHNYCHLLFFTVPENESSFSKNNVFEFFGKATALSDEWIYDFFSFLGWYGVPVFIFLTGFGLVRKYEGKDAIPMVKSTFLFYNWLKLLALLLPGVLYYVSFDVVNYILSGDSGYLINLYNRFLLLTFLNDILAPWTGITPGVYWYFGLTLEFYFLYAFIVYRRHSGLLILLTSASVALQMAVLNVYGESGTMLWWIRQNITGWMVPFSFGIFYARFKTISVCWIYIIVSAAVILFFPTMTDPLLWQLSLLCAIVMAIAAARISSRIPYWRELWIYIGRLSPFIFAAHPIVRGLFFIYLSPAHNPDGLLFISYIFSVTIYAILYRILWSYTTPKLNFCIDKVMSVVSTRWGKNEK